VIVLKFVIAARTVAKRIAIDVRIVAEVASFAGWSFIGFDFMVVLGFFIIYIFLR